MSRDSKFLSLVLRHAPEELDLKLDSQGWVLIDDLLRQMRRHGRRLSKEKLTEIVETNDKQRFTLSPDGRKIRAAQGHSVNVDLGLPTIEPPKFLYHGTAGANLDSIFADGLHSGRRRQVHLSLSPITAKQVGTRHGRPVVLRVEAGCMHRDGFAFQRADNGVWLTDQVPSKYLGFGIQD